MTTFTVIVGCPKPGGRNPDWLRRVIEYVDAKNAIDAGCLARANVIGTVVGFGEGDIDMDEYPVLAVIEGVHIDGHRAEWVTERRRMKVGNAA